MAVFTNYSNDGFNAFANSLAGLGQQLGNAYVRQGEKELLSGLGQKLAAGDVAGGMQIASALGNPDLVLKLQQQQKETEAAQSVQSILSGGVQPSMSGAPAGSSFQPNAQLGSFGDIGNRVIKFEGADGKTTIDNNGAPVQYGINKAANPDVNVGNLTKGQALQIYKTRYWDALGLDDVVKSNPGLAYAAFDTAVNSGVGKAKELLGQSGGDANKLLSLRSDYLRGLAQSDPEKYGRFSGAWDNRINTIKSDIGGKAAPSASPSGSGIDVLMARADNLNRALMTPNLNDNARQQINAQLTDTWKRIELAKSEIKDDPTKKLLAEADARKQIIQQQGGDVNNPQTQQFIATGRYPKEDQQRLTALEKKSIMDADEMVQTNQSVIENLNYAKTLSPKAMGFRGAGIVSEAGALIGEESSIATKELDNVVKSNALGQLKAIFGGAPTEGERAILLELQGASSQPDTVRQKIFDRAIALANKRLEFNKNKADELRSGTYFDKGGEGGQPKKQDAPSSLKPPPSEEIGNAKRALASGVPKEKVIETLRALGYSDAGL